MYTSGHIVEKHIREFQKMLQGGGLRLLSLERTGKGHYRALIEGPNGRRMTQVLASSPSDRKTGKNRKADVQRFFNN